MKKLLAGFLAAVMLLTMAFPALAVDVKLYSEEFYWDKAGEDADNGYKAYEVPYGSPLKIPEDPERYGSTFLGWKDWYTDQFVNLALEIMDAPGRRFYAAWEKDTYTSRFYVNGGLFTEVVNTVGEPFIHPRLPELAGYTFAGWDPKLPEVTPAQELEFNAVFEPNLYTSRFYVNGELFTEVVNTFGEPFIHPRLPELAGYTFAGWDPKLPEVTPAQDMEFNAVFKPNGYIATLMVDGEVYMEIPYTYGQKSIDLPPVPKKDGYTSAWESYSLGIGGVTIHAIYTPIEYIATLMVDGEVYMEIPYTYGQKSIDLPPVPK
ncbi:MAG: InlB B-repeat-containing protein, partial [Clostridia bacterium]|nr:InlB B-repeat-containing protein [Clostridia bacterium]